MAIALISEYIRSGQAGEFTQPGPNHRFLNEGLDAPYIIPGHFYSFAQLNVRGNDSLPSLDDWEGGLSKGTKPYFDNWPIFLALNQYGLGLNVKLIPQTTRKLFLRTYLKAITPILEKLIDESGAFLKFEDRLASPSLNAFITINRNWIRERIFSATPDIKFDFLVDKYNREEMRYLKMIDWPDVPKIGEVTYSNDPAIVSRSAISDYLKNV
jgi:hypothetical protein